VQSAAKDAGFILPVAVFPSLSEESLNAHWKALGEHFYPGEYVHDPVQLPQQLDQGGLALPTQRLARAMGLSSQYDERATSPADATRTLLYLRSAVRAMADLQRSSSGDSATQEEFSSTLREIGPNARLPMSIAAPGVASAYRKVAYPPYKLAALKQETDSQAEVWSLKVGRGGDAAAESAAINLLVAHRAVAGDGVGWSLPSVPDSAFQTLSSLERSWRTNPQPRTIWRLLRRLSEQTEHLWNDGAWETLTAASRVSAYSNFPIGLLTPPGGDAPLSCRLPVSHTPLTPLTRALQIGLSTSSPVDLSHGIRVLVAECIDGDDLVGKYSRRGWALTQQMLQESRSTVDIEVRETLSAAALRHSVEESEPNILIISAHGRMSPNGSAAGIVIGKDSSLGDDLGMMPPVVLLSACHVAPRGAGAVSVADLLIRQGAFAVLGTLVPVDVRHNTTLMMRFLLYLGLVQAGEEPGGTILNVWHRVQTSNAVNDIAHGNNRLQRWMMTATNGREAPLPEFMARRSVGRLRQNRIYSDTEEVLLDIAADRGEGALLQSWLRSPGYMPESVMYQFIGMPDSVWVSSPSQQLGTTET
jgi:CHAT domain